MQTQLKILKYKKQYYNFSHFYNICFGKFSKTYTDTDIVSYIFSGC